MLKKIFIIIFTVLITLLIPRVVISTDGENKSIPEIVVPAGKIPVFSHIVVIVLENHEFKDVYRSQAMPYFVDLGKKYTLLDQYYAIRHPSLPNYLALVGGDTFGITDDCTSCTVHGTSLADLIDHNGRTWKSYLENMPYACFPKDNAGNYAKRHNPLLYFDNISQNVDRCRAGIVPLDQLTSDLEQKKLPDFSLVVPNVCNDGHDCSVSVVDQWLSNWVPKLLQNADLHTNGLIVILYDEGDSNQACCGMETGGGHTATVLISPLVKNGYVDHTPYNHYSLLKTILTSWSLPELNHTADPGTKIIVDPWK